MNQTLNMSVRKFLKQVGVTSQQVIETAWTESNVPEHFKCQAKVILKIEALDLEHVVEGEISGVIDA